MHITRMNLGKVPPFTDPIMLKFDKHVNVFIGPNASGKSTVLTMLSDCLNGPQEDSKRPISLGRPHLLLGIYTDTEFNEIVHERLRHDFLSNVLTLSKDRAGSRFEPTATPENPPAIYIGPIREGLPSISNQENPEAYGETSAEVLAGPFSGSRTMCASELIVKELRRTDRDDLPWDARVILMDAAKLADTCCKRICNEVIQDAIPRNYIPDPYALGYLHHPHADPSNITILRQMGINTTDIRNFDNLPFDEQPSAAAYSEYDEPLPIYLGHLSSGTEGTLLWIRWLALKMVHHYKFEREVWEKKPAILLIDEIENHLHPTWQRRVIPALLEHFPGLQIFATTHSPFVVAGLKAGQVHLLNRDENGRVTATTNTEDVIGWTADEILRTMMGVDDPTDAATAAAARELRQLRQEPPRDAPEDEERRQQRIAELRQKVDRDLLAGGPMKARREEFERQFAEALEKRLQSRNLNQENG